MLDPRLIVFLRRAALRAGRPGPATSDAMLLERFAVGHDSAAFDELVLRHGPAVWALCRRLLRSEPDAEDTFQATFLVLTRQARSVRRAASVGSWLYGVAFRLARKARARGDRPPPDPAHLAAPAPPSDPASQLTWAEIRTALDEELARLPDHLRAPLLLCYFRGLTQDEAAAELGWKARTLKARVARGRELLRVRLTRRGIGLPAVLAAPLLSAGLTAVVPARVSAGLAAAAVDIVLGQAPGAGVSLAAVELARTGVSAMTTARTTFLVASAAALMTAGTVLGLRGTALMVADPQGPPAVAQKAAPQPAPADAADPLPPGAIARIGSTRFRLVSPRKSVFLCADGRTLIVTDFTNKVRYWNAVTGRQFYELEVPNARFEDADFCPGTGMLAAIGSVPNQGPLLKSVQTVWLIDTVGRNVVHTMPMPDIDRVLARSIRFTPDGKQVVGLMDGAVRVWDAVTGNELVRRPGPARIGVGTKLAISPDGKTVAFGHNDVYLFRWQAGEEPHKLVQVSPAGTELMAFAPDGSLYIEGRGPLEKWDITAGKQVGTLDVGGLARTMSFSPDGKTLAVGYANMTRATPNQYTVTLWDLATGKERGRLPLGTAVAQVVSWSPDSTRLVTGTNSRLWAWDVKTGRPLGDAAPGHDASITAFAFSPDGRLFTASDDHTVRSWDAATGRPGLVLIQDHNVRGIAVSPDGSLVAGSALANDLRVWDAKTGAQRFKLLGNGVLGGLRLVGFTADGARLVAWGDDGNLRVWDTRNGKLLVETRTDDKAAAADDPFAGELRQMELAMAGAALSSDGSTFALSSTTAVRVFDTATGRQRLKFEVGPGGATKMAFSPDGKRLAVAGRGKPIETKLPDGRTQRSPSPGYTITVWDLSDKKPAWTATADGSPPSEIRFTPDGARLAGATTTLDMASWVRFWEAATGKETGRIGLALPAIHFAFDHTGKLLAVAFRDTTALVYDVAKAVKPPPE